MADYPANPDWVDCRALRAAQAADGERGRSTSLNAAGDARAWRGGLRLIDPDPAAVAEVAQAAARAKAKAGATAAAAAAAKAAERAKAEADAAAKADATAKANAKAEREARAQAEAEAHAKAEALAQARVAAQEQARREAEARLKAEAEARARAESEARAKAEALDRAKAEAEERAQALKEARAKADAEAKAIAESRAREQAAAEARARQQAETEARAKAEAEAKVRAEAEAKAKAKAAAEAAAIAAAEEQARREAEARRQVEAEARAKAQAKAEAAAKARAEAEEKARLKAEAAAKAAAAKAAAEEKARLEAEAAAKAAAEEQARQDAEAAAKAAADEQARLEAEVAARATVDVGASLRRLIREAGPISLSQYMGESNARYYASRDPLGDQGDFITAPEVTQMFGELVGLWLADLWVRMGARKHIHYVELGPGRGTLARDALSTAARYDLTPQVHFVETSATLRGLQREAFPRCHHHHDLSTLPDDAPLLVVANEFFDALPVHQLVRAADGWFERMVGLEGDEFAFVAGKERLDHQVPSGWARASQGSMIETSPAAVAVMGELAQRLAQQGGAALIIDYGQTELRAGATLQALKSHRKVDVFSYPGEADITAHVDFELLQQVARQHGADVMGVQMQGEWLRQLGIDTRLEALQRRNPREADKLRRQRDRLVESSQMGTLFKVLGVCGRRWPIGVGFD